LLKTKELYLERAITYFHLIAQQVHGSWKVRRRRCTRNGYINAALNAKSVMR
jgi:hypothetical protein